MRFRTWTPILLAPVVALLAFVTVSHFATQADEARQAQIAFSQLGVAANRLSALEWRAVAERAVADELLEERAGIGSRIDDVLQTLGRVDADDEANPEVAARLVRSYEAAVGAELELIARGRVGAAESFAERVVDPAFVRLSETLGEIDEEEAVEAAVALRRATVGTAASLAVAALLLLLLFWRFHHDRRALLQKRARDLYRQALHDSLTGLPNRRKLMDDLERALANATSAQPQRLVIFDLDGFKSYNDTFGHPEGDLLLRRLGGRFAAAIGGRGAAYRLGGDEFCALIPGAGAEVGRIVDDACHALAETGEAFSVTTSFGGASFPEETVTAGEVLRLADQRMYLHKGGGRLSAREQARSLVLRILEEHQPSLREHVRQVASLARAIGERLGLDAGRLDDLERAAELHDVGKIAIPDSILGKNGSLDDEEWSFMRRHTLIGEKIVQAAPSLASVGRVIRSSHERVDGEGYPDGLRGEEIPLASRIVFVCDAYEAMTAGRDYRARMDEESALAELRRHAGSQFDPAVVEALCAELGKAPALRGSAVAAVA